MIYTITSVVNKMGTDCRCFGYFNTLEEARDYLKTDKANVHECLYKYCIIEEMGPGIHAHCYSEEWYIYTDNNEWKRINKPANLEGVVNFALG